MDCNPPIISLNQKTHNVILRMSSTKRRVAVVDVTVERRIVGNNMLSIIDSAKQKITSSIPVVNQISDIVESGMYLVSIQTLLLQKAIIDFAPDAYQRMYKASKRWQKIFIKTIFEEKFTIPAMTFRTSGTMLRANIFAECMDGLQRSLTILFFHSGLIRLPGDTVCRGIDIGGMTGPEIQSRYPELYREVFLQYNLTWVVYHNISDDDAKHIFTVILNNANALNAQEMRNSTNSALAALIRNMSRLNKGQRHEIFHFDEKSKSGQIEYTPKYLGFKPSGMKYDETLARIFKYAEARLDVPTSFKIDLGNSSLNRMYESYEHKHEVCPKLTKSVIQTLDKTLHAMKCADHILKRKCINYSTPNFLLLTRMVFEIYIMESGKIVNNKLFIEKFFDKIISLCTLTEDETKNKHKKTSYARAMTKMEPEFVHDATNRLIKTITKNPKVWGVVFRDSVRDFPYKIKLAAYHKQNGRCYITGKKLQFEQGHAAHIVAWSDGGKTNLENCAFICSDINLNMGTMNVVEYKEYYKSKLN